MCTTESVNRNRKFNEQNEKKNQIFFIEVKWMLIMIQYVFETVFFLWKTQRRFFDGINHWSRISIIKDYFCTRAFFDSRKRDSRFLSLCVCVFFVLILLNRVGIYSLNFVAWFILCTQTTKSINTLCRSYEQKLKF